MRRSIRSILIIAAFMLPLLASAHDAYCGWRTRRSAPAVSSEKVFQSINQSIVNVATSKTTLTVAGTAALGTILFLFWKQIQDYRRM